MEAIPLWRLNLPRGGVNATGNVGIISGSAPSVLRMDSSRSVRSSGSAGSAGPVGMEEERDGSDEKGRQSVTNPIPIVGGKMKKGGVEYRCESCNKVGCFSSVFFFWFSFSFPSNKPTNMKFCSRFTATQTA